MPERAKRAYVRARVHMQARIRSAGRRGNGVTFAKRQTLVSCRTV